MARAEADVEESEMDGDYGMVAHPSDHRIAAMGAANRTARNGSWPACRRGRRRAWSRGTAAGSVRPLVNCAFSMASRQLTLPAVTG